MTTLRLSAEYEQRLDFLATIKKKTRTDIIKEALDDFFICEENKIDSYKSGEKYFGAFGSGDGTLSTTYKSKIKDKINAKRNSH